MYFGLKNTYACMQYRMTNQDMKMRNIQNEAEEG